MDIYELQELSIDECNAELDAFYEDYDETDDYYDDNDKWKLHSSPSENESVS